MDRVSDKIIGRLARYRALLTDRLPVDRPHIFSHEIAAAMRLTPSQVRRDLMVLGYFGVPRHGYEVVELVRCLDEFLSFNQVNPVVVVGAGNLGRALIAFLEARRATIRIAAAFDVDPAKCSRVFSGVKCHPMDALEEVLGQDTIRIAILCVPAEVAQTTANRLIAAGVKGILNFAPVPLRVPPGITLEELDLTSALEKVVFFTNSPSGGTARSRSSTGDL